MTAEYAEDLEPRSEDYMLPILRVLSDGQSRTSQELREAAFDSMGLSEEQRSFVYEKSGRRRVDIRAQFALMHLRRAAAIEGGYGVEQITEMGRRLLADHTHTLTVADLAETPAYREYVSQRKTPAEPTVQDDLGDQPDAESTFWFVGATFEDANSGAKRDHSADFIAQGRWEIHPDSPEKLKDQVREMRAGDRIAIKAVYVRKRQAGVPFRTNGHPVSVMAIKATGTITGNPGTGITVDVSWDQDLTAQPREWFLYTYQGTIWRVVPDVEQARNLVEFAFDGAEQDIDTLRSMPYWAERFGDDASSTREDTDTEDQESKDEDEDEPDDSSDVTAPPVYTVESIIEDGCFLREETLTKLLQTLRQKKNLILQGPPGTGKTWLAKRLARALVEQGDPSLITAVQFHPTVSYEDFVRGWRPSGDGQLTLVDGTLLQIAERAAAIPDQDHVLVIEEINRGNLAQIFGEMLTLLEADKRSVDHGMHLAYRRRGEEPFHLPANLFLIGTMNLADRSLAMVDFALRRRFGFADLQPEYNLSWSTWVSERITGADRQDVERLGVAVEALNQAITQAPGLGEQYRIGHSFFTPAKNDRNVDFAKWTRTVIAQEIGPLLSEYWFDQPERVETHVGELMAAVTSTG